MRVPRPGQKDVPARRDLESLPMPARSPLRRSGSRALTALVTIALVAGILSVAQDVLMPLALAVLLAFVLAPLVRLLERVGLPRVPAVLTTVLFVFAIIGGLAAVVVSQSLDLAANLPSYRDTIRDKVSGLTDRRGPLDSLQAAVGELERVLPGEGRGKRPMKVEVVSPGGDRLRLLRTLIGPILGPAATAALVFVFVLFLLFEWDDLRDRLVRLSGAGQIHVTQRALEDAGGRVSHYLGMQLLINGLVGLAVGIGLAIIGVPSPVLWGLLSMALRFVPYIGPWLAAGFPILVSFAASPGWGQTMQTVGLFIVIELIANNLLEPLLYGRRTGVMPLGIIVSAVFWGWLWGGVGLVLATPLTVCFMVAGRYVRQLEFLTVLLSDDEALAPHEKLYHRLVALDLEEASEVVEDYGAEHDRAALCDDVLIPALSLAERDRHREALDDERQEFVYANLRALAGDGEGDGDDDEGGKEDGEAEIAPGAVLLVPALDVGDAISADMLADLLRAHEIAVALPDRDDEIGDIITWVAVNKPRAVVVCALPPFGLAHARRRIRKLRALFPQLRIVAGAWSADETAERRFRDAGADALVTRLADVPAALAAPAD